MKLSRRLALVFIGAAVFALCAAAAAAPNPFLIEASASELAQAGPAASFADVSPIFEKRCTRCHSDPKPPKGLRLDSYANVMKGGKDGKVVQPGAPEKSEMVKRVKGLSKPRMPRNGPPWLSDTDVALIEKWIAAGAPE